MRTVRRVPTGWVLAATMVGCQLLAAAAQPALSETRDGQQSAASRVEGWPQFRGPGSAGVADGAGLPATWSTTENVAWKTAIPGHGWSSPIAWGDRIFVTAVVPVGDIEAPKKGLYFGGERPAPNVEHRWITYAIDFATGKIVWQREAHRGIPPEARHVKNTYASETPVTDGVRVYVSSATSAFSPTTTTAKPCGRPGPSRVRHIVVGARPPRRCCTAGGSTSSTITMAGHT